MSDLKCSDVRPDLSLYGDGCLSPEFEGSLQEHLRACPLCRQELFEYREMRSALKDLPRPVLSEDIKSQLLESARMGARPAMFSFPRLTEFPWRQNWLSLAGSSIAAVLVTFGLFSYLLSGILAEDNPIAANAPRSFASSFGQTGADTVSPAVFARQRMLYSAESPSINPEGALAAMTKSLAGEKLRNDEMVVVARVFGNGLAQITDVVEPAKDPQAVQDLERALSDRRSSTPFVPARLDGRANDVQVVLKIQNVLVPTGNKPQN